MVSTTYSHALQIARTTRSILKPGENENSPGNPGLYIERDTYV
jgi:hypothetical protein